MCAQSLETTFRLGDSLCIAGDYSSAYPLLKRVLFFDNEQRFTSEAAGDVAVCLEQESRYKEAARYYEMARFNEKDSVARAQIILKKFKCEYETENFLQAMIDLLAISDKMPDSILRKRNLFLGATFLRMNEAESAASYFITLTDTSKKENVNEINFLAKKYQRIQSSRSGYVFFLSLLVPGSGQLCAGDVKNAVNSMAINGALAYLFLYTAKKLTVFDAFLSVFPWFQRYYLGGAYKALQIMTDKKERKKTRIFNKILLLTESNLKK
ncbi:MAG: hypothetical protein V2A54_07470 [Bacteroidota bacterium]